MRLATAFVGEGRTAVFGLGDSVSAMTYDWQPCHCAGYRCSYCTGLSACATDSRSSSVFITAVGSCTLPCWLLSAANKNPAAALRLLAVPLYCRRRRALPQGRYAILLAALSRSLGGCVCLGAQWREHGSTGSPVNPLNCRKAGGPASHLLSFAAGPAGPHLTWLRTWRERFSASGC